MISVCIPTYEQAGHGVAHLKALLDSIARQRSVEFEVVVSDNSRDKNIEELCARYQGSIKLNYVRNNETFGISNNTNNALAHASSDLIKIMFQDDLFIKGSALRLFEVALAKRAWVVSSYRSMDKWHHLGRRHDPFWHANILGGKNTIGMPSVIALRRNELTFDPKLRTRLDCDYYWQLYSKYGEPEFIREPLVGLRYWDKSASRLQGSFTRQEYPYLAEKHGLVQDTAPVIGD